MVSARATSLFPAKREVKREASKHWQAWPGNQTSSRSLVSEGAEVPRRLCVWAARGKPRMAFCGPRPRLQDDLEGARRIPNAPQGHFGACRQGSGGARVPMICGNTVPATNCMVEMGCGNLARFSGTWSRKELYGKNGLRERRAFSDDLRERVPATNCMVKMGRGNLTPFGALKV